MMDGRRHSVDIPISKALIALRRVRSLRDPSTNSMSKLSEIVDNLNWETNSSNATVLGFENGFSRDNNIPGLRDLTLFSDENQLFSDQELFYGSKNCSEQDETSTQAQKMNRGGSKPKIYHRKQERLSRVTASDVLSCTDTPCLSISESYTYEDSSVVELCHQGCGIGSCWSRTPKSRESNPIEEKTLLLEKKDWLHNNEEISYPESPRSLSQKFMPKSFNELVGQDLVVRSLLGAISNDKITSLYIFHGSPGTGKTSALRIFAAALNCQSSDVNKPCGACQECVLFFSGRSRDVKEVDSVGINKRDKCRSFIKNAEVSPIQSRFKVYIIEDCDLLRGETWTAILNGLDRIASSVVFFMVTCDLDKIPHNVVSKSQRFHFHKVKEVDIVSKLMKMCVEEGVDFDRDALNVIAAKSNGSLRDAEMMLDQLSLLEKKITLSLVNEVNGVVSDDEMVDLLYLALSSDAANTVKRARELMRSRIDPLQLISQLAKLIMDILAGKCPAGASEARRKLFGMDNSEAEMHQLSHALKILSQTEKQLRTSKNQATWLIVALLQLSSSHDGSDARLSVQTLPPQDGDFQSTSSNGTSLKHHPIACACNNDEYGKPRTWDSKESLELVWKRAIGMCTSTSLRKFLQKRGKLVSVCLTKGIAVAELDFDCPDSVSKAERSWKVIASSLQQIIGLNVELRISSSDLSASNKYGKFKNSSFNLFNCSRRVHLNSEFSAESQSNNASEISDATPKTVITRDKHVDTECGSQFSHICCHGRPSSFKTIRNNDGNAFSIGVDTKNVSLPENMSRENQLRETYQLNKEINTVWPSSIAFEPERGNRARQFLKLHCWRTAMLPFRKAWRMTHWDAASNK